MAQTAFDWDVVELMPPTNHLIYPLVVKSGNGNPMKYHEILILYLENIATSSVNGVLWGGARLECQRVPNMFPGLFCFVTPMISPSSTLIGGPKPIFSDGLYNRTPGSVVFSNLDWFITNFIKS